MQGFLILPIEVDEKEWRETYGVLTEKIREDVESAVSAEDHKDAVARLTGTFFASDSGAKVTGFSLVWAEKVHTNDEVSKTIEKAVAYVADQAFEYETETTIAAQSCLDLTVNLTMEWLDDPEKDARDIMNECYEVGDDESEEEDDEEEKKRETADVVLGWIRLP